jgi:hypothetical protein
MTNEQAIKYINKKFGDDNMYYNTARTFACEDIIKMDIEEYLKTPLSELLDSFIDNVDILNDLYFDEVQFSDENISAIQAARTVAARTRAAMVSMSIYCNIYTELKQKNKQTWEKYHTRSNQSSLSKK